jgi:hypothetical protein
MLAINTCIHNYNWGSHQLHREEREKERERERDRETETERERKCERMIFINKIKWELKKQIY